MKKNYQALVAKATIIASTALCTATVWAADYNVKTVTAEIAKGEAPVAAVAAATVSLLVVRRVWKIIKGSI